MDIQLAFIIGALEIMLLDLALCGDNIGIIALATRNLPEKLAKKASIIGIAGAIALRIIFACGITLILTIKYLPIKLLGGLLLLKITWDFIRPRQMRGNSSVKISSRFWESVTTIIIADVSMSLDNVLAIASAADGRISLIVFGIMLNIPIIFWGSRFVSNLMRKYNIVIYIGGAILGQTSFEMIFEDSLVLKYLNIPYNFTILFPWFAALIILIYGMYITRKLSIRSRKFHSFKHSKFLK